MDMQQTTTPCHLGVGLDLRQIDRHRGMPTVGKIAQLPGDEPADVSLRLLRRTSDVRCQDHIREALQAAAERISGTVWFLGKDVQSRSGDVPTSQVLAQRVMINDEPTAQIEEEAAPAPLSELLGTEQAGVPRSPVDVQRDGLGYLQ